MAHVVSQTVLPRGFQKALIKEYTLNHMGVHNIIQGMFLN